MVHVHLLSLASGTGDEEEMFLEQGEKESEGLTGKRDSAQGLCTPFLSCNSGALGLQAVELENPEFFLNHSVPASHPVAWK